MKMNWKARIKLLRRLVEARNDATALGFDGEAQDIRLLVYRLIRKWDDEFEKGDDNGETTS